MTFEEIYSKIKAYFDEKDFSSFGNGVYSYEFDITGEGEGKFYLEVRDGQCELQPYDYKNSTCAFTVNARHIDALLTRALPPVDAYATGRLRVRGDVSAAFRLADALGMAV